MFYHWSYGIFPARLYWKKTNGTSFLECTYLKKDCVLLPDRIFATCNCGSDWTTKRRMFFEVQEPCLIFCLGKSKVLVWMQSSTFYYVQAVHSITFYYVKQYILLCIRVYYVPYIFIDLLCDRIISTLFHVNFKIFAMQIFFMLLGSMNIQYFIKITHKKSLLPSDFVLILKRLTGVG